MKKSWISSIIVVLGLMSAVASAEEVPADSSARKNTVRFAYDATIDTYFDNRENDGAGNIYTKSMTIFGARVTPEVGVSVVTKGKKEGREAYQNVMIGVDVMKDFGSKETVADLFKEFTLYYSLDKKVSDKCRIDINAGIFPRTRSKAYYSEAFFSDSVKFYDPNVEGLLFGFTRPNSYFELGVDWLGQIGTDLYTREKFMIFTGGAGNVLPWMKLGYSAYMIHYANSTAVRGLIDNILANGYVQFDFGQMVGIQRLSVTAGYLQALQRDRVYVGKFTMPMGGELVTEVRHWNVGIRNRLYYGYNLMPFYNNVDKGGFKYGSDLYYGDPYYRIRPGYEATLDSFDRTTTDDDGTMLERGKPAIYDRMEVYWEPKIVDGLYFKIGAIFHFNKGLSGSNQVIAVRFNLNELINSKHTRCVE